ncbi:MAG: plastocyanin/azurin family copper-binding protein, partial [Aeromicrobium sp.]
SLSIAQGDTVTWTNMDSVEHDVTVTSGPTTFHSPMLSKGKSWSYTFSKPGTYSYICSVHPDMRASVAVAAKGLAATKAPQAAAVAPTTAPPSATVDHHDSKPAPTADATTAPDTTYVASAALDSATTMNPLLVVMGISAAVVVFCLLLMTSRPLAAVSTAEAEKPEAGH